MASNDESITASEDAFPEDPLAPEVQQNSVQADSSAESKMHEAIKIPHADEPLKPESTDEPLQPEDADALVPAVKEESSVQESPLDETSAKDYFSDDEEFLAGDDRVLEESKNASLIKQLDGVVSYNLLNFYTPDGKKRGKHSLRSDPPVFRIESSTGDVASFVVTQKLAAQLKYLFDTVDRGYYGVSEKKKASEKADNKIVAFTRWFESNPVRSVLIIAVLIVLVITAFLL